MVFIVLLSLMIGYHKLFYSKSLGADGNPDFSDSIIKGAEKPGS